MNYYRIVFARNEIISCTEAHDLPVSANKIEEQQGHCVFALVAAPNEDEAKKEAASMAEHAALIHRDEKGR